MNETIDLKKLKSSWTKYDVVKLIDIVAENKLKEYINDGKTIDKPVLKGFLGIKELSDELPSFWSEIQNYPKQIRLFSLIAAISMHYTLLKLLAQFALKGTMTGVYKYIEKDIKVSTNLRSALVISGAALQNYRREKKVPYTFASLFENGEVGLLVRKLFINRLSIIGYNHAVLETNTDLFIEACDKSYMIEALALDNEQFRKWIGGEALNQTEDVFSIKKLKVYRQLPMLRINQWMNEWDDINFDPIELRRKPKPYFYTFSIDARLLKRLSDVHRRNTIDRTSIQRKQSDARVKEINKYIEGGFPWSTLTREQQKTLEHSRLKMPGLLPTAIIINILSPNEKRNGKVIDDKDCLKIDDRLNTQKAWKDAEAVPFAILKIPEHIFNDDWEPELKPIEIIDGQHRLWAFEDNQNFNGNYELPVIAFDNLDRAWQAYLFYTINIKPVKINTSLGFDLYPMLRTQSWLESSKDGILAYRESRAQELVEALWFSPLSVWHNRINMIGETGGAPMSQAAFIRTLINSFFRQTKGLYSSNIGKTELQVLNWNRVQQAAFIFLLWECIEQSLSANKELHWANKLREIDDETENSKFDYDKAFVSKESFLSRDQGVRAIMVYANDFFYTLMDEAIFDLNQFLWENGIDEFSINDESLQVALSIFKKNIQLMNYLELFANNVIKIDWRTSTAPFDQEEDRRKQLIYKGSGGYTEFQKVLKTTFEMAGNNLLSQVVFKMK